MASTQQGVTGSVELSQVDDGNQSSQESVVELDTIENANPNAAPGAKLPVYRVRIYVLMMVSLIAATQNILWLTYNAMGDHVYTYFDMSEEVVKFIPALATIVYVILVLPITLAMTSFGIRKSIIASAALLLFCGISRLAALAPGRTWIIMIAQTSNAIVAPIVNSIPPLLSTVWFPPGERALATACAFLAQYLGTTGAFALGFTVRSDDDVPRRLIIEAVLSAICAIPVFIYFPEAPPTPPAPTVVTSITVPLSPSTLRRVASNAKSRPSLDALAPQPDAEPPRPSLTIQAKQYVADVLHILKNKEFILVALSAGISAGVYVGWSGLLSAIMMPEGYTQDQVSWLGIISPLAAMVGGVAIGKIAGMLRNKHRGLSLSLYVVTFVSFGLFMLSMMDIIPQTLGLLLILCAIAGLSLNAATPIAMEMCVEETFPSPEAASGGLISLVINLVGALFMVADEFMSPTAANLSFLIAICVSAALMFFSKITFRRINVDRPKNMPNPPREQL